MRTTTVPPPAPDEYSPFYAGYVARVSALTDPADELAVQRTRLLNVLSPLTDERAGYRYAPEKWSIKELVGHLADSERIMAYRLLRIARGDATPLAGFDENDYVRAAGSDGRPFGDLLDEWAAVRHATVALVAGLPPGAWARRGTANDAPVTARALLYIILGHVEHHRHILDTRYGV